MPFLDEFGNEYQYDTPTREFFYLAMFKHINKL